LREDDQSGVFSLCFTVSELKSESVVDTSNNLSGNTDNFDSSEFSAGDLASREGLLSELSLTELEGSLGLGVSFDSGDVLLSVATHKLSLSEDEEESSDNKDGFHD